MLVGRLAGASKLTDEARRQRGYAERQVSLPEKFVTLHPRRFTASPLLRRVCASPRPFVYAGCAAVALIISCFLGKDMQWDTLDYHFYAGFNALHDRFGQDYFPAGSQSYFNPYVYVPFYLLARSGLPALVVASILAVVQSVVLWLTYELALEVAPVRGGRSRLAMALGAVFFALANPILIGQFGSSYVDVTTGAAVLAGWLLLVRALRRPGSSLIACGGLLLGAASALKLTNSVHAVSAWVLLLFLGENWRGKVRGSLIFGVSLLVSFTLVCMPWALHLESQFGNPAFPLFNSVFRSPQYVTAPTTDLRFIPDSFVAALWRPFAIAVPKFMVDDESQSPDLRYAVLTILAVLFAVRWLMRRWRRREHTVSGGSSQAARAHAALCCAFFTDWILWLTAAGNGRYFIPAACVAAVIAVALVFQLFEQQPQIRNCLIIAIIGAQALQLSMGTIYRQHVPWDGAPWFQVEAPRALADQPALYFSYGVQSSAFIVPFLNPKSAFINVAGDYPLAPDGANGAQIALRVERYSPNLRVLARVPRLLSDHTPVTADLSGADDALAPFHLRADASDCSIIVIRDEGQAMRMFVGAAPTDRGPATAAAEAPRTATLTNTGYVADCHVVPYVGMDAKRLASMRQANVVLDRLEDACPEVFQPARAVTQYFGANKDHGDIWGRRYLNTTLTAWTSDGWVRFVDPLHGGPAAYVGRVSAFESGNVHMLCGRRDEGYYARVLPNAH